MLADEDGGIAGTFCQYRTESKHADRAGLPATKIPRRGTPLDDEQYPDCLARSETNTFMASRFEVVSMRTQEFWTLADEDRELIERLALGLGDDPARVLAYLLLRTELNEPPATHLDIRIGTNMTRKAVIDAAKRLESRGLLSETTVKDSGRGRPPKAWRTVDDPGTTVSQVYDHHAAMLCEQAVAASEANGRERTEGSSNSGRLTLGLNWRPNGLHVPFYTAKLADRYAERDVETRIEHHEGSRRALESVLAGSADVGVVGAATVVRARGSGDPVVPIAIPYQRALAALYTTREHFGEPLESVEQLRGHRIGMPAQSETRILGRLFLAQMAIADSVQLVDTAGEEQRALVSGEADVVTGSFSDPCRLEAQGLTVDSLLVADHFPIYGPTLVANADTLIERTPTLERFLAATMEGWIEARSGPDGAVERIAAESGSSRERVRRTFERAVETFGDSEAVRKHGWGWQRTETWTRLETALAQGNLLAEST